MELKLIRTFAPRLLALKMGDNDDELMGFAKNWRDISLVRSYFRTNPSDIPDNQSIQEISENCIDAVKLILNTLRDKETNFLDFFQPLSKLERFSGHIERSKVKRNYMRLYALRVDDSFVITGGGFKRGQRMQDYFEGQEELRKLELLKNYLNNNDVFDKESLNDFIAIEF